MKRIILKPGEERRILEGHPWVYDNQVDRILKAGPGGFRPGELEAGEWADLEALPRGKGAKPMYLGRGFVNPHSRIIMRLYSRSKEGADKGFFKRRIREALNRRLMSAGAEAGSYNLLRESARIVFAEADFLPGFMADRFVGWPLNAVEEKLADRPLLYEDVEAVLGPPFSWLSLQFLSWGMDMRREEILDALEETLSVPLSPESGRALGVPQGVVERSPVKIRELEGLPPRHGLIRGSFPPEGIVIFENGLPFLVHLEEGQKTGHFLDQRDNRLRAAAFAGLATLAAGGEAASRRVLDACCYTGGFGIHALCLGGYGPGGSFLGGEGEDGPELCFVDSSAAALETARKNAALNGVEDMIETVEADVF